MTNQHWSVLLETVSFFFVAIDLYGRERLERTQVKILSANVKLSSIIVKMQTRKWNDRGNRVFLRVIYFMTGIVAVAFYFTSSLPSDAFPGGFTVENATGYIFGTAIFLFSFYCMILLGILLASALFLFLVLCVLWLSKLLFSALNHLFRLTNFEGLLLITGSLMFLISKYLQLLQ